MPLLTNEPIPELEDPKYKQIRSDLAAWVFDYQWIGYQRIRDQLFFYRIPTLGECYRFNIAASHSPMAPYELLDRIKLSPLPKYMKGGQIPKLVGEIIAESYPTDDQQDNVLLDIMYEDQSIQGILVRALESHLRAIDPDINIWSMTYQELIENLAMKQVVTGEKIVNQKTKHKRRRFEQSGKVPGGHREREQPSRGSEEGPLLPQRS